MIERHPGIHEILDGSSPVVQLGVDVPELRPENRDSNGRVTKLSNLSDISIEANKVLSEKPWYRTLIGDVRKSRKSAIFIVSLGSLIIFVAGMGGFEFGVRNGKDLRILPKLLKRKR